MSTVFVYLSDLEAAINWWRADRPTEKTAQLAPQVDALANVYGQMITQGVRYVEESALTMEAKVAFERWATTLPDSPCIAICSTSVGDCICTGCGRSFDEITRWTVMSLTEKRSVWNRITNEGTWLRFTPAYADRLIESTIKKPARNS
jgi:predicted Fe-S protein YdhL (DUF1289 family)